MIEPEALRRKAVNLYPEWLCAWLAGEQFFPRTIPASRQLAPGDHAGAIAALQTLRESSKEVRGFGYSIEWREKRSRMFGRNPFPERIFFETQDDFLRFIGKQSEFAAFKFAVERLRSEFPELGRWIRSHRQRLIEVAADLAGLLEVIRYFQANPRPNRFARELPLSVDTKFIERHKLVLRDWFDLVLPPDSIRSDESHFCRRFGLLYPEVHVFLRFLDDALQTEVGCPWQELSLPISALAVLPVRNAEVFVVENKVSLLGLSSRPRTLGVGAIGDAASELRHVHWLANTPITYWGDIDVDGFEILSALRRDFPQVRSVLMDAEALITYEAVAGAGNGRRLTIPTHLTPSERLAFERCCEENLRIEQERIPYEALRLACPASQSSCMTTQIQTEG